jgi:mannose-6-phosphate isomerase-like protein (cupin superfamily)
MPILRFDDRLPDWGELEGFDILRLLPRESLTLPRHGPKELLFVGEGTCHLAGEARPAREGDVLQPRSDEPFGSVTAVVATTLVHAWGTWGEETGGSGVFTLEASDAPSNTGDPAPYPRNTVFDRHYHDCDEYWILFGGSGLAVTEGVVYAVGAGDCVATRTGDHHDFPYVHETVRGIYLETTLRGQKRRGHLWEHTRGTARVAATTSQSEHTGA